MSPLTSALSERGRGERRSAGSRSAPQGSARPPLPGDGSPALGRLIPAAAPWLGPCFCPGTASKSTELPRSLSSPLRGQAAA